ncbi:SusD/RagB family nutrient-binding outer membrane lipoprotein [Abyssalbus ytuae]|uniref:SusD/RagB family nutrient-binding outer membrane lipoprotein n=1 Tax=Abyssalbus ytuae TaxID=2926907 RepID=A0A9E6ZLM3_9FLAO|nr:SusD/RagB family nutrient-binding outer membrane lipoprotein [Abyssalbus ytuae]UOB18059.1 SusD/RagB family nutrient-binding outer membrane lipoprotein [Abyssalbus ytuae]
MKINNNIKLLIVSISIFIASCSDDYFDVNTPSDGADFENLALKDLLEPIINYTLNAQYNTASTFGVYSQHLASYNDGENTDNQYETTLSTSWNYFYLYSGANLIPFIEKANESNSYHYEGIGKILLALNLGLATDAWGDIPYTGAFLAEDNLSPEIDSQEFIYNEIQDLLDEGIEDLSKEDNGDLIPGAEDVVYGGDISKWIKAAYTLKARYAIHLTKKDPVTAANNALTYLENGFSDNSDDFQIDYSIRVKNPWFANIVQARLSGNFSLLVSDQLVSLMNGTQYGYTNLEIDPRLPVYVDNGEEETYEGAVNGTGGLTVNDTSANTDLGPDNFYTGETSPVVIISYAEALLIKAEAEFLLNGGNSTSVGTNSAAYESYLSAISANMEKLGVEATPASLYLTDSAVDVGEAGFKLEHLMKEKYIVLFLNPEGFTDLRRYDFSSEVFKGLEMPAAPNPENNGNWVRRAKYPSSEELANPNIAEIMEEVIVPVWWDE